jgi:hypothetical protein
LTVRITCCWKGCHLPFYLDEDIVARLRASSEDFHCPFGHAQNYGPSEEQKFLASRKQEVDRLQSELAQAKRTAAALPKDPQERLARLCLEVARRVHEKGAYIDAKLRRRLEQVAKTGDVIEPKMEASA